MAHTFKTISAKPTFGKLQTNNNQSDYVNRKKATICQKNCNLISSQYSIENLKGVCTVSSLSPYIAPTPCSQEVPCTPCQNNNLVIINPQNATSTFYSEYNIDPLGQLFGNSQCGELNYTEYMRTGSTTGFQGATGAQGEQGTTGAQGDTGTQGGVGGAGLILYYNYNVTPTTSGNLALQRTTVYSANTNTTIGNTSLQWTLDPYIIALLQFLEDHIKVLYLRLRLRQEA
jgi:hypothetical protein